jgi:fermentation-respiration switch protein FrsA (DUF1100 family)
VVGRGGRRLPGTVAGRRAVLGSLLVGLAVLLLSPVARGVEVAVTSAGPDGLIPVRVYVPGSTPPGSAPGVVVAHGFAGSAA